MSKDTFRLTYWEPFFHESMEGVQMLDRGRSGLHHSTYCCIWVSSEADSERKRKARPSRSVTTTQTHIDPLVVLYALGTVDTLQHPLSAFWQDT
jgi:hypothetical protein